MTQISTSPIGHDAKTALQGNAACVLGVLLFAAGFPAAEVLLESWGAISLIAVRCVLACMLLFPIWVWADGWRAVIDAPWWLALAIGAVGFGTGTVLLIVVQDWTDPVTAVLVAATMPVSAVALEVLFDGRRLTINFLLGLFLVLLGGLIATGVDLRQGEYGMGLLVGILASLLFAWGSRGTVKNLPEMSNIGRTTITLIGAMVFCLATYGVFVLLDLPGKEIAALDRMGWSILLFYGFVAMAISQLFWIFGVSRLGVGLASFHLNAAPFYVMLILLGMGGAWEWQRVFGAVILAAGVIMAQRRRGR